MDIRPDTLKRLRQDRGISQEALAERADVTTSYISKLESGAKANPSEVVVARIAHVLAVEPFVLRFDPDAATAHLAEMSVSRARERAAEAAT